MKRLNPDTGKPFKFGDTRLDGFLFDGYRQGKNKFGYFYEAWLSPEAFLRKLERTKKWQSENHEALLAASRKHYKANKVKRYESQKRSNEKHKDRVLSYRKNNRHVINARESKRRATLLQRTPKWLNAEHQKQIQFVFGEAKRLSKETGIPHDVDHIVPLQGKTVSGLHVPWNLRAIPASENRSKSNRTTHL